MKKKILGLLFLLFFFIPSPVLASNDLTVTCDGSGSCTKSSNLPIFDDSGLYPGQVMTSRVTVKNTSSYSGSFAFEIENLSSNMFNSVINLVISSDQGGNNPIYGPQPLNFLDGSYIVLENFIAGETKDFYYHAIFDQSADNTFQNLDTSFDMILGFDFIKPSPNPTPTSTSNTSFSAASSSQAKAPTCENDDLLNEGPKNFRVISQTSNSVTLSWDSLKNASGYAIFFTRSDGETYSVLPSMIPDGITQYTINNLSAANYQVEIAGVGGNDQLCGSDRSFVEVSIYGGAVIGRPQTQEGDILGQTFDEKNNDITRTGEVEGTSIQFCSFDKNHLPWILLLIQSIFILLVYYLYRSKKTIRKQLLSLFITLLSITIFYLFRQCDCVESFWWMIWICKWYFVVSVFESSILQLINYSLIESN